MHVLLDTHALLWWFADDPALSKPAVNFGAHRFSPAHFIFSSMLRSSL
jgi:PIN domain nuclease of toxin-antitoxin system